MKIDFIYRFYKNYISPLNPPSCRFYPTCSTYAMLCFKYQNPFLATFRSIIRILKCNHLFSGGIEYPIVTINNIKPKIGEKIDIDFWLVPVKNNKFYIINKLKETN